MHGHRSRLGASGGRTIRLRRTGTIAESFNRLIAAYVADDQDHGRDRMVREFIAEFRGFARSDIQKTVLDDVGAARVSLREFFTKPKRVEKLLA